MPAKISVDMQDDQDKPQIATELAHKFCDDKAVGAVLGSIASTVTLGTQPIYNSCDLTQIVPAASNDSLTTKGYQNFFRTTAINSQEASKACQFIKAKMPSVKTIVTIDANDASTVEYANIAAAACKTAGLSVLDQVHVTPNGTDYRGALTAIIAKKPDLMFLATFLNDSALLVKQGKELGYTGQYFGADGDDDPAFVQLAGAANVEGMFMTDLGYDPSQTPTAQDFVKSYTAAFSNAPNTYAANAFDATNAVIAAWKAIGGIRDRKALQAQLKKTTIQGTFGPVAFDNKGDLQDPKVGVFQIKGGQITYYGPA